MSDRLDDLELVMLLDKIVRDDPVTAIDSRAVAGGYQPGWIGELRRVRSQLLLQPTGPRDVTAVTGVRGHAPARRGLSSRARRVGERAGSHHCPRFPFHDPANLEVGVAIRSTG
jgi:hypothetical protein